MRWCFLALICVISTSSYAQNILRVSSLAWDGLASEEKTLIQTKYVVEAVSAESFGFVIDNQGIDQSTPGTNAGTRLGESIASAAYVDNAFKGGNYSAKGHLGAMLLGGMLGSTLDSRPQSSYHFRYAIKLPTGNVVYQDAHSSDSFRHPVGVCVLLPAIDISPEQHLCNQTTESLRAAHIPTNSSSHTEAASTKVGSKNQRLSSLRSKKREAPPTNTYTLCRVGVNAPIKTTLEKCQLVNGVVLND